ncbi:hypothetical protein ACLOJK_020677 [Asimina triloba]
MYHPTRGGVRGGRDQFKWDDVKVDKHRENYLGHSVKAPVGRWQKGKDLFWYARDKKSEKDTEAAKEEIRMIKEQEEQAMREALGLAPKSAARAQGSRLDKHEFQELVKRGSTADDLGAGHAEAARVQGLGFSRAPKSWGESNSVVPALNGEMLPDGADARTSQSTPRINEEVSDDEGRKKRKREEKKNRKHEKEEKRRTHDSNEKRRHKKDKERRRHDSD